MDEDTVFDLLQNGTLEGTIDLDEVFALAMHGYKERGSTDPIHLFKIWKIKPEVAKHTIDVTTQKRKRKSNPKLSRNYKTNDRMLRYKRINQYFYMDTFFATSKGGRSSRVHTCCQLFVTDKGYVYVVPMRARSEVVDAVKQFAKEIGAPDAIICDAAREQISQKL